MAAFEPERIFEILARHKVEYVLIGGVAATLHGSNLRTGDVDVCPAKNPGNLERLAGALKELRARIRTPDAPDGVGFECDARFLRQMSLCNLTTRYGDFDISFRPDGTKGYEDLLQRAVVYGLAGVKVPTAALADIIRSKEAAGRSKDLSALPTLRALQEETNSRKRRR